MLFQASWIAVPLEITAFSAMITFWDTNVSPQLSGQAVSLTDKSAGPHCNIHRGNHRPPPSTQPIWCQVSFSFLADVTLTSFYLLDGLEIVSRIKNDSFHPTHCLQRKSFSRRWKVSIISILGCCWSRQLCSYACGRSSKSQIYSFIFLYSPEWKIIGGLVISLGGGPDHQVWVFVSIIWTLFILHHQDWLQGTSLGAYPYIY